MDNPASRSKKITRILKNRKVLILVQVIFISAAIILAVLSLRSSDQSFELNFRNIPLLIAGALIYFVFFIVLALHWVYAIFLSEKKQLNPEYILSFFASQPYKYLPTSIFSMSSRSLYSKKIGAQLRHTISAQVREYASLFISGLLAIGLLKFASLWLTVTIASTLIILALLSYRSPNIFLKYLSLLSLSFLAWLVGGLSLQAVVNAMGAGVSYSEAVFLNTFTFLASIAAVFVPAGLGIREAILITQNVNLGAVFVWRICTIIVDVISGVLAIIKIHKK
jgi:hypothetical protein